MNDFRKKLLYQSWHRGCKETDVVIGPFAEDFLPVASEEAVQLFTTLLAEDDWDIWQWITRPETTPERYHGLLEQIRRFQQQRVA
jgi:antitoxin CptB